MAWTEKYVSVSGGGLHDGSSEANAWTMAEAVAGHAAGMRLNIKGSAGNYLGVYVFSNHGTDTQGIWLRAYSSTIGDGGRATIGDGITANASLTSNGNNHIIEGFDVLRATTSNIAFAVEGNHSIAIDCTADHPLGLSTWNFACRAANGSSIISCAFRMTNTSATLGTVGALDAGGAAFVGCAVEGIDSNAYENANASQVALIGCILKTNGSDIGIHNNVGTKAFIAIGNTVSNSSDGINLKIGSTTDTNIQLAINNIIDNCTNGIVASTSNKTGMTISHNSVGRITSNRYDVGDTPISGDYIHTRDPFVDAAGGDYRPNDVDGGGMVPRGKALEPKRS